MHMYVRGLYTRERADACCRWAVTWRGGLCACSLDGGRERVPRPGDELAQVTVRREGVRMEGWTLRGSALRTRDVADLCWLGGGGVPQ